ncbi:histidine kinase [Spirillospora sp. NPDC029432]|uniref:sensor histidine kinase n=1 Tax=Spirillospora sp. NPDC029432 TaxID=3154599 RepID=UPI003455A8E4
MDPSPSRPRARMASGHYEEVRGRLKTLNIATMVVAIGPVGAMLVAIDARAWWEAAVLSLGVAAGLVAVVCWTPTGFSRVVLPCTIVAAAVWVAGALAVGGFTAFYGISVVGSVYAPKLPRHRALAAAALIVFIPLVGAMRLVVAREDVPDDLVSYVLIPAGVAAVSTAGMFAGQWYYDLVEELAESRERQAELAVVRERVRFAGDLHDIQGHTLHVVKLKAALARKLVRADPGRAEEELGEIHALVGETIARTKELAYAQRRLNLSAELENAKNLFEAAGIRVRVDREAGAGGGADELLGQVLRETTTNILRHAQAGRVRITLTKEGITIVNDGAQEAPLPELRGLANLRERIADAGGELTVEQKGGSFLTAAAFPHGRTGAGEGR